MTADSIEPRIAGEEYLVDRRGEETWKKKSLKQ